MEFESADLGEASFSHPSFSTDLSTVPPAASTPAFRPPPFLPRSLLSPLPRIHSLLISSSLVHRDGIYERGRERGERGQIEMLYYLNSVATTVRDLLVDVAPDSPL